MCSTSQSQSTSPITAYRSLGYGTHTWPREPQLVDFKAQLSPESGDMDIVRQSAKRGRRLRVLGEALAAVLVISVPGSAITLPDATAPKLTTLYSFPGGGGGGFLEAGLILNPTTGVLYGTTADGG